MLKTSKLISLLLVVALMLSVFSGLIVTTSAAAVESATIVYDGQTKDVHVGDTITYTAYMDVTSIPTASDGYVHGVDAVTYYDQSNLTLSGTLGRKNCPNFYSVMFGTDEENAIYYNDVDIDEGFLFEDGSVLITMSFEVVAGGTSTITNKITEMYKAVNGRPKYFYYGSGEQLTEYAPTFKSTLEVTCPHPDETEAPATEAPEPTDAPAPTTAGDKAVITIYGLDGSSETKEFNVGDTFTVYTTLNTSAYLDGSISSVNATQTYTNALLALADEYDPDEGGILDLDEMFPITKGATVANGMWTETEEDPTLGAIYFNASKASIKNPFRFDDNNDILIKSNYTVTAAGVGEIRTGLTTLVLADDVLTRIVNKGEVQEGMEDFRLHMSYTWPEPEETDAPTDAPATEAPVTEAPVTEAPTEPETEAPVTEAPTEPETEAPVTEAPADTYIVAGNASDIFGTSWNGNDANNTMTKGDDGVYTKEYTVDQAYTDVQLKAVKNGADWIGDETGNNVTFNLSGAGTFTVYCDGTKTWVDGDIVTYNDDLVVDSVTAVGNGSADGDNWLNNVTWDPAAEANHMTKVADGVYEIEYTLGEYDTDAPEFKFAINDAWTHSFGIAESATLENGVETDAAYNGNNIKLEGLTAGTTITMQLDLSAFDFASKTGAKMTITWTAPEQPTEAPATDAPATEAPVTEAPTEPETEAPNPTDPPQTATITIYGLDGQSETKEFGINETFKVYTILDAKDAAGSSNIASVNGEQTFTDSILELITPIDEEQTFTDNNAVFPVMGDKAIGRLSEPGTILYNGSTPSVDNPFVFDGNATCVIVTEYKVTAGGEGEVRNALTTLAAADEDLTRLVDKGAVQDNATVTEIATFTEPVPEETEAPTDAPATEAPVTEAPVTEAPTEPETEAPATEAPTEPETEAPVTEAPADTYIVAGNASDIFGTSWNGNDANNTMTKGDDGVYTKEYTVDQAYTDVQLKAVKNGSEWIGDETGNNVTFNLSGAGTFTVYCDGTKTWVDGDIVTYNDDLVVDSVTAVGNGSADGDNWLNNVTWDPAAEANHMTKVADGVYEIEYTLGEYDTDAPEFKFAINDAWTHSFGIAEGATLENGVETDAAYNGQNIKIEGLEEGTTIKMQLDLTNFDFASKTGAKMTITWTAPQPDTQAPETQAPETQAPETQAPETLAPETQAPETQTGTAIVTIYGLDGESETKEFNVGDTFTVYTTLNTSEIGEIGSLNGTQTYTNSVLALADAYDPEEGDILDLDAMFPITGQTTVANGKWTETEEDPALGAIYFNASTPSITNAFAFDSNNSILIKTNYTVTAPGEAEVRTNLRTLAIADDDLTRIIDKGVIVNDNFRLHASYRWSEEEPTEAPVTEAPATDAPTEAPATDAPTEAPATNAPETQPTEGKAIVNIYGIDGDLDESKEFNVGDTFTVYTILNAKNVNDGKIASISGRQTYTDSVVALADALDAEGAITDLNSVFPITGDKSLGNAANSGVIYFNASTPGIDDPFVFDNDSAVLIKTTYTVFAPGTADIQTIIKTLASADEDLTRIIDKEVIQPDMTVTNEFMTFKEPAPVPTQAPVPTETETPTPTETEAPQPTETEAPQPTETEAPQPTETEAPQPTETEAPQPTETEAPQPTEGKAIVNIYGIDGDLDESKEFNVGDTFTVYTILNTKDVNDGKIASISGRQTYTDSVVALADAVDAEGAITDLNTVFPITGEKSIGNAAEDGVIYFNASTPGIDDPFVFDNDSAVLIKTTYTVSAPGTADIKTIIKTLASADEDLTRIIDKEVIQPDMTVTNEFMTFKEPAPVPTQAPATEAPATQAPATEAPATQAPATEAPATQAPATEAPATQAPDTEAPATQAPDTEAPATQAPETEAPKTAIITIYGIDGSVQETREFNVGDTFTVYTYMNASDAADGGKIASVNASQTYSDDIISLTGDPTFPILTDVVSNTENAGAIKYNASTPSTDNPFVFDSDDDVLIRTTYIVTAPGEGEVRNAVQTLAAADEDLTPIIKKGDIVDPNKALVIEGSFKERQPEETTPAETTPEETTPAETTPEETTPAETTPGETTPGETTPGETTPGETTPGETTPVAGKIIINADGYLYEVERGTDHVYTYYLTNAGTICGIDASTTWDTPYLTIVGDPDFPTLNGLVDESDPENGGNVLLNDSGKDDGKLIYNYTNAYGADFSGEKAPVITFTIHVDENTPDGIYYITTNIKTLEGEEEEKQVFEDTDTIDPPVQRRGELDGQPGEKEENKYTADEQTYVLKSGEDKTFTVNNTDASKDGKTYGKFRSLWIDLKGDGNYTLVSYDNYTKASGSLKLTLKSSYMDTLKVGDYNLKFVFSDGEAVGVLHVLEGATITVETSAATTAKPAATTKSSTVDTAKSTTNSSAVQTGSPEIAILFVMILMMSAGIILFTKKRKND